MSNTVCNMPVETLGAPITSPKPSWHKGLISGPGVDAARNEYRLNTRSVKRLNFTVRAIDKLINNASNNNNNNSESDFNTRMISQLIRNLRKEHYEEQQQLELRQISE